MFRPEQNNPNGLPPPGVKKPKLTDERERRMGAVAGGWRQGRHVPQMCVGQKTDALSDFGFVHSA